MVSLLEQVLEKYPNDVKLVFKNFPLGSHEFAMKAATAALAAEAQGRFWDFHDLLFRDHDMLNDEKIAEIAVELELNQTLFDEKMRDPDVRLRIQRDIEEGEEAGVTGTPAIFINGRLLRRGATAGFVEAVSGIIDGELSAE